jgi:ribosomal protein S18 acetylase RimI-like enzyme
MDLTIRPYNDKDLDPIVELSLLAWEPVFESFEMILGHQIYPIVYPDWRASQAEGVAEAVKDEDKYTTLVAEVDGAVAGFISYSLNHDDKTGEVVLLAVHPEFQNKEIGTELNKAALDAMKEAGMKLAVVGTGGEEGHAPARRTYEKAGYTGLPLVRYYKKIED